MALSPSKFSVQLLKLPPSPSECQALTRAFLRAVKAKEAIGKNAAGVLRALALFKVLPTADQLLQMYEVALAPGDTGIGRTTSNVNSVFYSLRMFATKVPGGKEALLQHQDKYMHSCDVLLEAFRLFVSSKAVPIPHISYSIKDAATLATTDPPFIALQVAQAHARQLITSQYLLTSDSAKLDTLVKVCETVVQLDMKDLAPVAAQCCKMAAKKLSRTSEGGPSNRRDRASLWHVHCWLVSNGQEQVGLTEQQLRRFEAAAKAATK